MKITITPKGRGLSRFVAFFGKRSFTTDKINGFDSESICKAILFDAVLKRADVCLDNGNGKRLYLTIHSIDMTNKNNSARLTGLADHKIGYGSGTVKFVGLVKF